MATNHTDTLQTAAPIEARRRFSDRIEFRRGRQDAQRGRAPASLASHYMAGYKAGRQAQRPAAR